MFNFIQICFLGAGISDTVSSLFPGVGVSATTVMSSTPTTNTTTTAASVTTPPQPQFVYHDINIMSLGGMAPHITINDQVGTMALRIIQELKMIMKI